MEKISNEQALSFIDSFLTEVHEEKTAEESPITVNTSDTGGEAAGTIPASVAGTDDNSPEKTKTEEGKPQQGAFGKEKSQDMGGAIPTIGAEDAAAENNESNDNIRAAGDFNQEAIEGEQEEQPSYIDAEKMKVAEEINMKNELERAQGLANAVIDKIASLVEQEEMYKDAGVKDVAKKTWEGVKKGGKWVGKKTVDAAKATGRGAAKGAKAVGGAAAKGAKATGKAALKAAKHPAGAAALGAAAGAGGMYAANKYMDKKEEEIEMLMKEAADEAYHDFVTSYQMGLIKRAQDEAAIAEATGLSPEDSSALLDEVAAEDPEAVMPAEVEAPEEGGDISEEELLDALVELGVTPEELAEAEGDVDAEDEALEVEAAEYEERHELIKDIVRAYRS